MAYLRSPVLPIPVPVSPRLFTVKVLPTSGRFATNANSMRVESFKDPPKIEPNNV
jgi:hypothetical protein